MAPFFRCMKNLRRDKYTHNEVVYALQSGRNKVDFGSFLLAMKASLCNQGHGRPYGGQAHCADHGVGERDGIGKSAKMKKLHINTLELFDI